MIASLLGFDFGIVMCPVYDSVLIEKKYKTDMREYCIGLSEIFWLVGLMKVWLGVFCSMGSERVSRLGA